MWWWASHSLGGERNTCIGLQHSQLLAASSMQSSTNLSVNPPLPWHALLQALQEGLRLLGVPLDCGGLQSPGAAALVRGGLRAGSYSTTTFGSSAQVGCCLPHSAASSVFAPMLPGGDASSYPEQKICLDTCSQLTGLLLAIIPSLCPAALRCTGPFGSGGGALRVRGSAGGCAGPHAAAGPAAGEIH